MEKTSAFNPKRRAAKKWPNSWMKIASEKMKEAKRIATGHTK
jgi:hypothetical protein